MRPQVLNPGPSCYGAVIHRYRSTVSYMESFSNEEAHLYFQMLCFYDQSGEERWKLEATRTKTIKAFSFLLIKCIGNYAFHISATFIWMMLFRVEKYWTRDIITWCCFSIMMLFRRPSDPYRWIGTKQLRTGHRSTTGSAGSCSHPDAAPGDEINWVKCCASNK